MLPYGRQSIDESDLEAVLEVLRGDWLTTGPRVAEFEAELSRMCGGRRAVSSTSGTAALHIGYRAAGVGLGDQVITTPMTFVATASTASILGAEVLFADILEDVPLIDPGAVESLVSSKTKVIAAVDYAGHPSDYSELQRIADANGALTLCDAAHSIGGSYRGRNIGEVADITTFSFFPTKNLTTGEGGATVFADERLGKLAHEFHFIGLVRDPDRFEMQDEGPWHQEVHEFGLNYRLSDIACALGLSQLRRLEKFKQRRAEIVSAYNGAFAALEGLTTPVQRDWVDPMWHLYAVRIHDGRRREIFEALRAEGIGVQVNYIPVYWHPVYRRLGYRRGMCPNAEAFYEEQLSLPLHPSMSDDDVSRVVEAVTRLIG